MGGGGDNVTDTIPLWVYYDTLGIVTHYYYVGEGFQRGMQGRQGREGREGREGWITDTLADTRSQHAITRDRLCYCIVVPDREREGHSIAISKCRGCSGVAAGTIATVCGVVVVTSSSRDH